MSDNWGTSTKLVHGGTARSSFGETSEAIFLTSGFVYEQAIDAAERFAERDPGFTYSRLGNPTTRMLEERVALLEGAEVATAVGSGMAAVHGALISAVKTGSRIVASALLFGSCHWILTVLCPRFGVEVELVDGKDLDAWRRALGRPADIVFLETPGNPTLELVDIKAVAELAHAAGAKVMIDNVFATPLLQKPLQLGADVVIYSATKHIDGQGRCLGGLILSTLEHKQKVLTPFLRNTGPSLSPFNAWVLLKGLETLPLRVRAQTESAGKVAAALEADSRVAQVLYPGLPSFPQYELAQRQMSAGSTLLALRIKGGRERAFAILDRLKVIKISNNLGDSRSLITHPASTTHSKVPEADRLAVGIDENLLRLSVGLEDAADLIADLDQALGN